MGGDRGHPRAHAGWRHDTGAISWGASGSYAIGNINLTSGSGYIRTHAATDQDNDVKVV